MSMKSDTDLQLEVAKSFYEEELSKTAIAKRLGCSITQVGRILKAARSSGIVEIRFRESQFSPLAARIRQRYPHVEQVLISPAVSRGKSSPLVRYAEQLERMAKSAADVFKTLVDVDRDSSGVPVRVGLGGGRTIFEMVAAIPSRPRPNAHFYSTALLGRGAGSSTALDPQTLCVSLWARSGMFDDRCHFVTVPPYLGKSVRQQRAELEKKPYVKDLFKQMEQIDIAFFTLGAVRHELEPNRQDSIADIGKFFSTQQLLDDIHVPIAHMNDAAGEVCYSFFDESGREIPKHNYFLSVGANFFRKMTHARNKKTVMVAGSHKIGPILAALEGQLCNIWVTDEIAATKVDESVNGM